jgi:hypothetical protein
MRSVLVHLPALTEAEIIPALDAAYPHQPGPHWICEIDGNACLYIGFYRDHAAEFEPEHLEALLRAFGGRVPVSLVADVSGRWPGDEQVRDFVRTFLTRFGGFAQDDYSEHLWSLEEVLNGTRVEGHPFFDYRAARLTPGRPAAPPA